MIFKQSSFRPEQTEGHQTLAGTPSVRGEPFDFPHNRAVRHSEREWEEEREGEKEQSTSQTISAETKGAESERC